MSRNWIRVAAVAGAGLLGAALYGHYTWVSPGGNALTPGSQATVTIGHGHGFPESSEAPMRQNLEAFVMAPSGAKSPLAVTPAGKSLSAKFAVQEPGPHRLYFSQDFGVRSRTPQGLKPGGRDANPQAVEVLRSYRSGVAYAGGWPDAKPLGLEFEVAATRSGQGLALTVYRNGKPCPKAKLAVLAAGAKEKEVGVTGADGGAVWQPGGAKGPVLIIADYQEKAAAGAQWDVLRLSSSLRLEL
jgi:hypothetical protein